jgi:hypothetical protein
LTFGFFAVISALVALYCYIVLPDKLNLKEDDEVEGSSSVNGEEKKLMEGYNNIKMEEVGMLKIICQYDNFMALFGNFISMFGSHYYVGFFSTHLKKRYNVDNKAIGLFWGVFSVSYLIGCTTFPYIFEKIPPLV